MLNCTKMVDRETLQVFFCESENPLPVPMQLSSDSEIGTPLCTQHYGAWYRHINPSHIKCTTCNKNIAASKGRPFPEPTVLQTFLRTNTDFSGKICPQDRVCYACYRSHLFYH